MDGLCPRPADRRIAACTRLGGLGGAVAAIGVVCTGPSSGRWQRDFPGGEWRCSRRQSALDGRGPRGSIGRCVACRVARIGIGMCAVAGGAGHSERNIARSGASVRTWQCTVGTAGQVFWALSGRCGTLARCGQPVAPDRVSAGHCRCHAHPDSDVARRNLGRGSLA